MKILVPDHLPTEYQRQISEIPGVSVSWLNLGSRTSVLSRATNAFAKRLLSYELHQKARRYLESSSHVVTIDSQPLESRCDWQFDALLTTWMFDESLTRAVIERIEGLTWVHSMVTGIDHFDLPALALRNITLTSPKAVHASRIAEFVLSLIFADIKNVPEHIEASRIRKSRFLASRECKDVSVGIIGFGSIGRTVGQLAAASGMRVVGYRRAASTTATPGNLQVTSDLPLLLQGSDIIVLALPSTPDTRSLISHAELEQLRAGATIINVGRGDSICQDALVNALGRGRLRRVYLDVLTDECTGRPTFAPSSKHPLRRYANVIFTGYSASESMHSSAELFMNFLTNLECRISGRAVQNSTDLSAGY